ncbi:MAG: response regulator [Verrucomicrobiota bacterium]
MNPIRILLIQTEQVARERLAAWLRQEAYTIVQANNGAEGLALFRQGSFDLVITDYQMPFLSGCELAVHIKGLDPMRPVLMMSGSWQRPSPENPVDASLPLGCNPARLREVLAELLSSRANAPFGSERETAELVEA